MVKPTDTVNPKDLIKSRNTTGSGSNNNSVNAEEKRYLVSTYYQICRHSISIPIPTRKGQASAVEEAHLIYLKSPWSCPQCHNLISQEAHNTEMREWDAENPPPIRYAPAVRHLARFHPNHELLHKQKDWQLSRKNKEKLLLDVRFMHMEHANKDYEFAQEWSLNYGLMIHWMVVQGFDPRIVKDRVISHWHSKPWDLIVLDDSFFTMDQLIGYQRESLKTFGDSPLGLNEQTQEKGKGKAPTMEKGKGKMPVMAAAEQKGMNRPGTPRPQ